MINDKLKTEFAKGAKNPSIGCKFHLSFIVYHSQFIIKKVRPLAPEARGEKNETIFYFCNLLGLFSIYSSLWTGSVQEAVT